MVNPQAKEATDITVQGQICFFEVRGIIHFESVH
jgi:hypothetical protein